MNHHSIITWIKIPNKIDKKPVTKEEMDQFIAKGGQIKRFILLPQDETLIVTSARHRHR